MCFGQLQILVDIGLYSVVVGVQPVAVRGGATKEERGCGCGLGLCACEYYEEGFGGG